MELFFICNEFNCERVQLIVVKLIPWEAVVKKNVLKKLIIFRNKVACVKSLIRCVIIVKATARLHPGHRWKSSHQVPQTLTRISVRVIIISVTSYSTKYRRSLINVVCAAKKTNIRKKLNNLKIIMKKRILIRKELYNNNKEASEK